MIHISGHSSDEMDKNFLKGLLNFKQGKRFGVKSRQDKVTCFGQKAAINGTKWFMRRNNSVNSK